MTEAKPKKGEHAPDETQLNCEVCKSVTKAPLVAGNWVRPPDGWWVSRDETALEIRALCPVCFKPQLRVQAHLRADKKSLAAMKNRTSFGPKGGGKG